MTSEFLLRVQPADGGYVATCQPMVYWARRDAWVPDPDRETPPTEGHGATPLAALVNALANSQVQDITETDRFSAKVVPRSAGGGQEPFQCRIFEHPNQALVPDGIYERVAGNEDITETQAGQ